jgi:YD repeat-containing protein
MKEMNTTNKKGFGSGFAVPGMLLNLTLGSVLVVGTGSFGLSSMHKMASMASYPGLNGQSQTATSLIARDIRQASSVECASSDQIVLKVRSSEASRTIAYAYDAARHTVTRTDAGTTQTLLTGVEAFSFSLFQRPAANAAFDALAPATAQNARMVGCNWSCSRKLAGTKVDLETVQIAPTVLRNRTI